MTKTVKIMICCGAVATLCGITSRAEAQGAFCAEDAHGYRNCGFYTLAQCQEALRGMGGTCSPNPAAASKGAGEATPSRARKGARPER